MDIEVFRSDLSRTRTVQLEQPELSENDVRVRVDGFALTSNNISYAVFGDLLRYWNFFPATDGWGRIPTWGVATVTESLHPDVSVGTRVFGYFPMSDTLTMTAGQVDGEGFSDLAPHRSEMASAYNRYLDVATDATFSPRYERHHGILFPLFFTSWVVHDYLVDNDDFLAEQVVVSSASSKTALGLAHLARQRGRRVVGLTSAANVAFTQSLDVYDQVTSYDRIGEELPVVPSVYVDISGSTPVLVDVHTTLDAAVVASLRVGGTHWDETAPATTPPPGPSPEFFFAPTQIAKRSKEWGRDELFRRLGADWAGFVSWVDSWMTIEVKEGPAAVTQAYLDLLAGRIDPATGYHCILPGPA